MNRRGFLKFLGITAAAAVVQPKISVFLDTIGPSPEFTEVIACDQYSFGSYLAILKKIYSDTTLEELIYKENPFIKLVDKETTIGGYVTIDYGQLK